MTRRAMPELFGSEVTHDLETFEAKCDVIATNCQDNSLTDAEGKVYMRDLYKGD